MSLEFFFQQPSVLRGVLSDFLHGKTSSLSLWDYLKKSTDKTLFESAMIGMISSAIYLRESQTSTAFTAFVIGIFLSTLWLSYKNHKEIKVVDRYRSKVKRLDRTLKRKRNFFDKSARSLLLRNPALVEIFSKLYVFARFDRKNFKDALIFANQLVRVHESSKIGVVLPDQIIDIAEELQRKTMNSIHSIAHSLPSTTVGDFRWQVDMNILQKVLQKITDDIRSISRSQYKKTGPTIYNPPPDYRSGPWPNPTNSPEYSDKWDQYY